MRTGLIQSAGDATNLHQFVEPARTRLDPGAFSFIAGAADDGKTMRANEEAFDLLQIRARRMVGVTTVYSRIDLFGDTSSSPILLAPVGIQKPVHPDGELAVARAASARDKIMIASTISSYSIQEITKAGGRAPWFQLYAGADRAGTEQLVRLAESAGCHVLVLTVDTPVVGNREGHRDYLEKILSEGKTALGNFVELGEEPNLSTESMTWNDLAWLCSMTEMKVVVKGIVTREDAEQVVGSGASGIIVSNHGGRQEESNRGTLECLPEVIAGANARIPVLMDGGIRRGTDVFKALALGAHAVCIGRPYMWGLAAFGQAGVERVLEILDEEFVRIQQLGGTPNLSDIGRHSITSRLTLTFLGDSN